MMKTGHNGTTTIVELTEEQIQDYGMCKRCEQKPATTDYNGHKYYVCKLCDKILNDEFDDEYR